MRVTDIAELHARDAVTWGSWTDYLCAKSTDGLLNDDICGSFPFLRGLIGVRRSALIEKWLSSAQYLSLACQNGGVLIAVLGPSGHILSINRKFSVSKGALSCGKR